jgi:hypothetical protein
MQKSHFLVEINILLSKTASGVTITRFIAFLGAIGLFYEEHPLFA